MSLIATPHDWNNKHVAAWTFAILWSLDTVLTAILVLREGFWIEANPVMRWTMLNGGLFGFVAVKSAILCGVITLAPRMREWLLWFACCVMVWPVALGVATVSGPAG